MEAGGSLRHLAAAACSDSLRLKRVSSPLPVEAVSFAAAPRRRSLSRRKCRRWLWLCARRSKPKAVLLRPLGPRSCVRAHGAQPLASSRNQPSPPIHPLLLSSTVTAAPSNFPRAPYRHVTPTAFRVNKLPCRPKNSIAAAVGRNAETAVVEEAI